MKKYIRLNRAAYYGALVCVFFSTAFAVVLQFFKGDVLDSALAGNIRGTLRHALLLFGFILAEVALFYLYDRLSARFTAGCARELKADIFASILARDYVRFRERPQGEYIAKYTNEADTICQRRFAMLPMIWEIGFKILFVSGALFLLDWRVAILTLLLLTTPLYVPKLIEARLQKAQEDSLRALETAVARVDDWLSGFEVIKNFSAERRVLERFAPVNGEAARKMLQNAQVGILARLITTLISYLSYFAILAYAARLVLAGDFSAGDFFVAIGMIDQLSYPLIALSGIIRELVAIRPVCRAMEDFLAAGTGAAGRETAPGLERDIRFEGVSFSYDGERPVLADFNLVLEKGKRYLLKGRSGCGKTTAANLLLRYFEAGAGRILIDGIPIDRYAVTYSLITVARQEAFVFNDTLRNNLTMYREVDDARLTDVLNRLGLFRFAQKPLLDAVVAQDGVNLSGGERRRICLARALLRDTEVLIADEPLANLDEATARAVEEFLLTLEGRTLLVISHQFSETNVGRFDEVIDMTRHTA